MALRNDRAHGRNVIRQAFLFASGALHVANDPVIDCAIGDLAATLDAPYAGVAMLDRTVAHSLSMIGLAAEQAGDLRVFWSDAVMHAQPVNFDDLSAHPAYDTHRAVRCHPAVRAFCALPITLAYPVPIGAIFVADMRPRRAFLQDARPHLDRALTVVSRELSRPRHVYRAGHASIDRIIDLIRDALSVGNDALVRDLDEILRDVEATCKTPGG
ncbi:hypothetical protein [Sphingomonas hylomeconis]|uniref:GAF domain-containing protein n=1 Tax=Sphingomonas hylomeconis TaxID=1395958 RepID=A0ABV7STR3_9SPHN|nr:hypothetical protein [Sphingomonas hylomeconis]